MNFLLNAITNSARSLLRTSSPLACSETVSNLLQPKTMNLIQAAGFKVKGKLRKRCKDCYFVRRQERLFVICNTHRRHKQMSMIPDPKNTWILSHATMGKTRTW